MPRLLNARSEADDGRAQQAYPRAYEVPAVRRLLLHEPSPENGGCHIHASVRCVGAAGVHNIASSDFNPVPQANPPSKQSARWLRIRMQQSDSRYETWQRSRTRIVYDVRECSPPSIVKSDLRSRSSFQPRA
ncbi:MAG: hypothetical protein RL701_4186, partial [Pseudomonadota bacterium]